MMAGYSRTWGPSFVNVATRVTERTLPVQSTTLASNQFTTGFLRHAARAESSVRLGGAGIARIAGVARVAGIARAEVHVRKGSCVEATVSTLAQSNGSRPWKIGKGGKGASMSEEAGEGTTTTYSGLRG